MSPRFDQRLDRLEQAVLAALYAFFAYRFILAGLRDASVFDFIYLFDQSVVVLFLLIRRPTAQITRRLSDWFAALIGTAAPLFVEPVGAQPVIAETLCLIVFILGSSLHLYSKLTLRRSLGAVPAHRGLKLEGPYRFVRHPMYLGYIASQLAFLAAGPTLFNAVILAIGWAAQVWRIENEERLLSHDPAYAAWRKHVRYRLFPGVY